jgi:Fur family ferric uptake transcriptional regulator
MRILLKMSLNNNSVVMDPIKKFREYIKDKGLRNTPEREMIVREIFSIHDHFDADELFLRLRNQKKIVSRASVYRTIPLLIESGLVKEVYFENGHLHYEHIYGHKHHCHLRCICCGKIHEFGADELARIESQIGRKHGFVVTSHRFEFLGYCAQCSPGRRGQRTCRPSGRGRIEDREKSLNSA